MMQPHEHQAIKNHEQDLEELARRGGLDTAEAIMVIRGMPLKAFWEIDWEKLNPAVELKKHVENFMAERGKQC